MGNMGKIGYWWEKDMGNIGKIGYSMGKKIGIWEKLGKVPNYFIINLYIDYSYLYINYKIYI